MANQKICIVSTRHISYNPRVLKEADTLNKAGFMVTVVTINNHELQNKFDQLLMKNRQWKLVTVNFRKSIKKEKLRWIVLSLQNRFFNILKKITVHRQIAEKAADKAYSLLKKAAIKQKADLYIAHHAEALGAAYAAAKINNAKWGFDAEDFHSGMSENFNQQNESQLLSFIEKKYLPKCNYITAASKGIGEAYKNKYRLQQQPSTILNVFPKMDQEPSIVQPPIKFYWYSQVIGPTRNLELLMNAAGKLRGDFQLHLRGSFHSQEYHVYLQNLIRENNITEHVYFHKPIIAEEIISEATAYDVGLALESAISINRNICVTNKIFSYLMSGLAIVGTDTYGQKDIFTKFSEAVKECKMDDEEGLAEAMQYFIDHPDQLTLAKTAARKAAINQFNWETESEKLLNTIEMVLRN